jgi:hypothetical protein
LILLNLPGGKRLTVSHAIFGLNGTLAVDGYIEASLVTPLKNLARRVACVVLTTDTYGTADRVASELGLALFRVGDGLERLDFSQSCDKRLEIVRLLWRWATVEATSTCCVSPTSAYASRAEKGRPVMPCSLRTSSRRRLKLQ